MLEILDMLSLPGDPAKPNDDAFCHSETLAAVFDGATGLGEQLLPVDSDAAWIARRGAEGLILHEAPHLAPREILFRAAFDAEKQFHELRLRPPAETYEIPFASMMYVSARPGRMEALWFGDCAVLVKRPHEPAHIVGDALDKRAAEAARVARLAAARNLAPAAGVSRAEYLPALRAARNCMNTVEGSWAFCPDAACADHAQRLTFVAPRDTHMLLVSDGFLALASDYLSYDAETLLEAAKSKGLRALYGELRAIEEADPEGRKYPRFKKSDDATALLVKVSGVH
ncbi:MAG TPA: hypothetical protein VG891_09275 [Rhizomicrobium sp.]|nr:hypothetical protein [Rhizomicrobium sp.]